MTSRQRKRSTASFCSDDQKSAFITFLPVHHFSACSSHSFESFVQATRLKFLAAATLNNQPLDAKTAAQMRGGFIFVWTTATRQSSHFCVIRIVSACSSHSVKSSVQAIRLELLEAVTIDN
jgi:hypothetical protein